MRDHAGVEVVGIYEPDPDRRTEVENDEAYDGLRWFDNDQELLGDEGIRAVASEGGNSESLEQTERRTVSRRMRHLG